eukprot:6362392-Pyramimonas_sp.AAC.1
MAHGVSLGASRVFLEAVSEPLEGLLRPSWGSLGAHWGLLGATRRRLGVDDSKCPFGFLLWAPSWGCPGAPLG